MCRIRLWNSLFGTERLIEEGHVFTTYEWIAPAGGWTYRQSGSCLSRFHDDKSVSFFFLLRFTYMLTHRFPVLFGATNGPLGKMDFWSCNFLMLKSTISRVWWVAEVKTVLLLLSADNSLRIHWMNFPIQYAHVGTLLWWAGNKLHAIDMKQWESRRNIGRSSFIYTWGFYLQVRLVQVAIQQQRRDDRRTSLRVSYIFQL